MPTLSSIPNHHLKILFLLQCFGLSLALQGDWIGVGYLFYNSIFILLLLWGLHRTESEEPIQLALLLDLMSIILDIITMTFRYYSSGVADRFGLAFVIIVLFTRPISCVFLAKLIQERTGTTGPLTDVNNLFPGGSGARESYEDIDRSAPRASYQFPAHTEPI